MTDKTETTEVHELSPKSKEAIERAVVDSTMTILSLVTNSVAGILACDQSIMHHVTMMAASNLNPVEKEHRDKLRAVVLEKLENEDTVSLIREKIKQGETSS